jgi:hypothetical protein
MRISLIIPVVLVASVCLSAQTPAAPQVKEAPGIPPRATPADYLSQGPAGTLTVAAEFMGHSVPTPQGLLTTEEFVVVEAALFGPSETRSKISIEDFSLRINDKKTPIPSQPYGLVAKSLKDPDYELPNSTPEHSKTTLGKTGINTGGGRGAETERPVVVHIPIEIQRGWEERVRKASLPEGDRPLPQAGLIFFPYRGKVQGIHSLELIYSGPAGKGTLTLHP